MLEEQLPEQLRNDSGSGGRNSQSSRALFSRDMPGGGSVRVEIVVDDHENVAGTRVSGRVVMERERDASSEALVVVEELEGSNADEVVPELLRIARDNAAIARRVLRHRAGRRAD